MAQRQVKGESETADRTRARSLASGRTALDDARADRGASLSPPGVRQPELARASRGGRRATPPRAAAADRDESAGIAEPRSTLEDPTRMDEDTADLVANEERDVATGDAALGAVQRRLVRGGSRRAVRPDDRIREEIEERIANIVDSIDVTVEVVRGEVSLKGLVDDDGQREAVERCVQRIDGVRTIDNRIELREDPSEEGSE